MSEKLVIVIPAYNEEDNIKELVYEWYPVINSKTEGSKIIIFDDGSTDNTRERLLEMQDDFPRLEVVTKPNSGHGGTIYYAYKYALDDGADYIFQTDSDRQTLPEEFEEFWGLRSSNDAVFGKRIKRGDGISRFFVTTILRYILLGIFQRNVPDANVPFRLIKADVLKKIFPVLPVEHNLSNITLSLALVFGGYQIKWLPITFKQRDKGENKCNYRMIVKVGLQAVLDFVDYKKVLKTSREYKK